MLAVFLSALQDADKIKVNTKRLVKQVKKVQLVVRDFFSRRTHRVEYWTKQWQRIEDRMLQASYRELSRQLMFELQKRLTQEAAGRSPAMARRTIVSNDTYTAALKPPKDGWKEYRVDEDIRFSALNHEFMRRVRQYVKAQQGWKTTTRIAL